MNFEDWFADYYGQPMAATAAPSRLAQIPFDAVQNMLGIRRSAELPPPPRSPTPTPAPERTDLLRSYSDRIKYMTKDQKTDLLRSYSDKLRNRPPPEPTPPPPAFPMWGSRDEFMTPEAAPPKMDSFMEQFWNWISSDKKGGIPASAGTILPQAYEARTSGALLT